MNFSETNFRILCDELARQDDDFKWIILNYGYPPLWSRQPGFATLIHIILEQQVSLASAKAAMAKLQTRLGDITPENLLALSDIEMKACYFSRQKTTYARHLAEALLSQRLNLDILTTESNETVRQELKKIPGIGDWTVDVYLMMALHRTDCFPLGDIALINSLKKVKRLPKETDREEISAISNAWRPHRTIAAFLLWHSYLRAKGEKRGKREKGATSR